MTRAMENESFLNVIFLRLCRLNCLNICLLMESYLNLEDIFLSTREFTIHGKRVDMSAMLSLSTPGQGKRSENEKYIIRHSSVKVSMKASE